MEMRMTEQVFAPILSALEFGERRLAFCGVTMLALVFEVSPREGHESHYFERAAILRPRVEANPGLLFLDRYRSLSRPGIILSHSLWKDEASLNSWRTDKVHRSAQDAGRSTHFADYRIRIAPVIEHIEAGIAHSGLRKLADQAATPEFEHDVGDATVKYLLLVASLGALDCGSGETFESLNKSGVNLTVTVENTLSAAQESVVQMNEISQVTDIKCCTVLRDYGMFDRAQAPAGESAAE